MKRAIIGAVVGVVLYFPLMFGFALVNPFPRSGVGWYLGLPFFIAYDAVVLSIVVGVGLFAGAGWLIGKKI